MVLLVGSAWMGKRGEPSMVTRKSGVTIAMAAILVQAPRLVLAVLAADHQEIGAAAERWLLVVAGIGTATVLTGGNLYLAHVIASVRRRRRWLILVWLLVLASSGALVVPLIAAGLHRHTLPELLDSAALGWTWSGLAALAHEVTAAACMLAAAALGSDAAAAEEVQQHERAVAELLAQRDAARGELAGLLRWQQGQLRERQQSPELRQQGRQRRHQQVQLLRHQQVQQRPERAPVPARGGSDRSGSDGGASDGSSGDHGASSGDDGGGALRSAAGLAAAAAPAAGAVLVACREGCGRQFSVALAEVGHLRHCAARLERLRREAAAPPAGRIG
jgi:hypothetical protein